MLNAFSVLGSKKIDDGVIGTWQQTLLKYSDEDLHLATKKCVEECGSYPKPKDVIDRITFQDRTEKPYKFEWGMCSKCGEFKQCIREPVNSPGECRECYTGLTDVEIRGRFNTLIAKLKDMPGPISIYRRKQELSEQFEQMKDEVPF